MASSLLKLTSLFALLYFLTACNSTQKGKKNTLFQLQNANTTNVKFVNKITNDEKFNIFNYRNFYNGGGVGIGDINNDGLADIFFTSNMGKNKLYLNKGNFAFEDISTKAGIEEEGYWNTGVAMADINADGWLDIYVCNAGIDKWRKQQANRLFINNKNGTFTESAAQYGLDEKGYTTHAAFFDYDLDGDLDCYILNNSFIPVNTLNYSNKRELRAEDWPVEDFAKGGGDKLLRNDAIPPLGGQKGGYVDVSKAANIYGSLIGFGLGVTVSDVNKDGYPDLYISNDFFERDYLYINNKNGTFKEELQNRIKHTSLASMGADAADINNDGYTDLFTTDMLPSDDIRLKTTASFDNYEVYQYKKQQGFYDQIQQNALQVNNGDGTFKETARFSGVAESDWSWGALFFDANNDGLNDIYVCNGIYKDLVDQDFIEFFANSLMQSVDESTKKESFDKLIDSMPSNPIPNKFFKNEGNLKFDDAAVDWGTAQPSFSNGAAYGDLDNDGDLDLVVNNVNMESFLYKNNTVEQQLSKSITFSLKGYKQNTFAIGSVIKLYSGNEIISREVYPARGFQSSIDYKTVMGIGNKKIDSIHILWPDKQLTKLDIASLQKDYIISYDSIVKSNYSEPVTLSATNPFFTTITNSFEKHSENEFIDFFSERNIPLLLSKEGPKAAIADVNGDKLDDVFIGGAKNQAGQLYLQKDNGFTKKNTGTFDEAKASEDVAVVFFDADKDGDQDLFVGSGGNNEPPQSSALAFRLYNNDGVGNFTKRTITLPNNMYNTSVVLPWDFDTDGDMDLFIGSRSVSYNYGITPNSYLLQNDGKGNFVDVTTLLAPSLQKVGNTTAATLANINGDGKQHLVIVGEWMYPIVYSYSGGKLMEDKTTLNKMYGWWYSVKATDVDKDGKDDIVLGNIGQNFYLKPTTDAPVKLWMNDFDKNGSPDKVFSKTINGKDVTVFLKKEFTEALPSAKKENLRYHAFATKSIQHLFSKDLISTSVVKTFNYASSCIAYSNGNGNFTVNELPIEVQLSSVNAIESADINKDGLPDLILGGNLPDCLPQFGRLDASTVTVLINKSQRNWQLVNKYNSGISIDGVVRDMQQLNLKNKKGLLVLRNNDTPILYSY